MTAAEILNTILSVIDYPDFIYLDTSVGFKCRLKINGLYFWIRAVNTFEVIEEDKLGPNLYDSLIDSSLAKELENKLNANI